MMFYTQLFTSKRGPLAKIWLAAHWERKITKAHVFDCNLETTIKDIISPKMKIGLRSSGHLLLGVVRIYSRKTKYLLADCNEALVKIKVSFRPEQTDLPAEGLEATLKAITLIEEFADFDTQLPNPRGLDAGDFSLNQSRTDEITLKEDYGNSFLTLRDFGDENHCHHRGLLDMSFHSLAQQEDGFGDEDRGCDLLDFISDLSDANASMDLITEKPDNPSPEPPPVRSPQNESHILNAMEVELPTQNETTLLANEEEGFALEPVPVTPTTAKRKEKRKRKLVVDQTKELSNEAIRVQLEDFSDLLAPFDMAPPTRRLMQWKENGGADRLFGQLCSTVLNSQIRQLFTETTVRALAADTKEENDCEQMREDRQSIQRDASIPTAEHLDVLDESHRQRHDSALSYENDNQPDASSDAVNDGSMLGLRHPELPSEDSMFVHPSGLEQKSHSTAMNTQSLLDSQEVEERRMTRRVQKFLNTLKSQSCTTYSLSALCERSTRVQAAGTFFILLVLKKQQALDLHQDRPYEDITATPGPRFYDFYEGFN